MPTLPFNRYVCRLPFPAFAQHRRQQLQAPLQQHPALCHDRQARKQEGAPRRRPHNALRANWGWDLTGQRMYSTVVFQILPGSLDWGHARGVGAGSSSAARNSAAAGTGQRGPRRGSPLACKEDRWHTATETVPSRAPLGSSQGSALRGRSTPKSGKPPQKDDRPEDHAHRAYRFSRHGSQQHRPRHWLTPASPAIPGGSVCEGTALLSE